MTEHMQMKLGLAEPAIARIGDAFEALSIKQDTVFDREDFEADCLQGLRALELKQRVDHVIQCLQGALPTDFGVTAELLLNLPAVWDRGDLDDPLRGFAAWPVIDLVAVSGINHPELALRCLENLTPLFSAEFAIRPFIEQHPNITFEFLMEWLTHNDENVRRLVSEGTRPRLPWGRQLKGYIADPSPILPLLNDLKSDSSLYVRRSVANNLNDIAKDHPETVLALCLQWQDESKASGEDGKKETRDNIEWLIRHATRSLVKQGHPKSFVLLGYTDKPRIAVHRLRTDVKAVKLGASIMFTFELEALAAEQKIVVDYAVHYRKANGSQAKKVFKLKNCDLSLGERVELSKKIDFKPISTRKYYTGKHAVAIHINGVEQCRLLFEVVK